MAPGVAQLAERSAWERRERELGNSKSFAFDARQAQATPVDRFSFLGKEF